jgi:hypothetical protein
MTASETLLFALVIALGLGALLTIRWIRKRGPVPEVVDDEDNGFVLRYLAFHYGTMVLLVLIVAIAHLPARPVLGLGIGGLLLFEGLARPSWSRASKDISDGFIVLVFLITGICLMLVGIRAIFAAS